MKFLSLAALRRCRHVAAGWQPQTWSPNLKKPGRPTVKAGSATSNPNKLEGSARTSPCWEVAEKARQPQLRPSPILRGPAGEEEEMKNGGSGSDGGQPKKTAAVIGAGIAGLTCATALAECGISVTVLELARGPGGRMSQRRENWAGGDNVYLRFDHGAQYIHLDTDKAQPEVIDRLKEWRKAGVVEEWRGRFGTVNAARGEFIPEKDKKIRLVGVPGMNAICQTLAKQSGVEVRYGSYVGSFKKEVENPGRGGAWQWILKSKDGGDLGNFNALVISDKNLANERFTALTGLPPPLESAGVPDTMKKMASVVSCPCFALMLAFKQPLEQVPFDGAIIQGSELISWVARDSSKPGRPVTFADGPSSVAARQKVECWVVHSTAEYAAKRIAEGSPSGKPSSEFLASVADELFAGFRSAIANDVPTPCFMRAHRWGSAFPLTAAAPEEACLADPAMQLFACGDFCTGPAVELAIWSGLAAAKAAFASLQLEEGRL